MSTGFLIQRVSDGMYFKSCPKCGEINYTSERVEHDMAFRSACEICNILCCLTCHAHVVVDPITGIKV